MVKEKCWFCKKRPRVSPNDLFCKQCKKLKTRPSGAKTYIIYDKI